MKYTDEMYHAATKIMQNRADQLGLDDDELMHYGRKGMKWGKDIFAQDDSEKKQSGGPWGNNAFTNTVNDPKYNPIKKAQLEKKRQELLEKAKSVKPMKDNFHGNLGYDHDPMSDSSWSSDHSPYTSNRVSQQTAGGREIVVAKDPDWTYYKEGPNGYSVPQINKVYFNPNTSFDGVSGRYSTDEIKQNERKEADMQARKEAERKAYQDQMDEKAAVARDAGESMRAIREGKAPKGFGLKDSGAQSSNIYFTPEGKKRFENPYLHLEEGKDYTLSTPYAVPYEAEPNSQGGTSGALSKGYGKEIQENLNKAKQNPIINEQISKYGNQQPEKNDEQRIAEKARGQYIREEQKKQRQDELNKKKQELLEKARREKTQRTKGLFSPDVTREHQQAMVPVREGKAGEILENSYGPDNTVFKTDAKNQSRVNFDRYKKQHNAR